jgi:transposase
MSEKLRFLGLDVHAETIVAALAEPDGEVRSLGTIPNRMESVRKLLKKLGPVEKLRFVMKPDRLVMCCTGSWRN